MESSHRGYGALPAFGLINRLQVGDTGPAESTRQGNLQRVWSSFSGLAGQSLYIKHYGQVFHLVEISFICLFVNFVLFVFKVKTKDLGGYATTKQFTNAVISNLRTPAA